MRQTSIVYSYGFLGSEEVNNCMDYYEGMWESEAHWVVDDELTKSLWNKIRCGTRAPEVRLKGFVWTRHRYDPSPDSFVGMIRLMYQPVGDEIGQIDLDAPDTHPDNLSPGPRIVIFLTSAEVTETPRGTFANWPKPRIVGPGTAVLVPNGAILSIKPSKNAIHAIMLFTLYD